MTDKSRCRGWVFDKINAADIDECRVQSLTCKYLVYCRYKNDSDEDCITGYVYYRLQKQSTWFKRRLPGFTVVKRLDDHNTTRNRIIDGRTIFTERGVPPEQIGGDTCLDKVRRNKRLRDLTLNELVDSGDISILQVRALKRARDMLSHEADLEDREPPDSIHLNGVDYPN